MVPAGHSRAEIDRPDLPELRLADTLIQDGELILDGVLVERDGSEAVRAGRIVVTESELRGVAIEPGEAPGLRLRDVILRACDLSNVDGREGSLRRVEIHGSRLMGFGLAAGDLQDVRIIDSSLALSSLAFSEVRDVSFERVDLTEVSFMETRLENVAFNHCKLAGADFRAATLRDCVIRGTSLDGILGVDRLRGITMPWVDILGSAAALADALGIKIESP